MEIRHVREAFEAVWNAIADAGEQLGELCEHEAVCGDEGQFRNRNAKLLNAHELLAHARVEVAAVLCEFLDTESDRFESLLLSYIENAREDLSQNFRFHTLSPLLRADAETAEREKAARGPAPTPADIPAAIAATEAVLGAKTRDLDF